MSALHTLNKSPDSQLLKSCLAVINDGDAIVFIEDGIYHCSSALAIESIGEATRVYGLREDMLARATLARIDDSVEIIDTARFVALCCEHDKVVSWF